MARREGHLPSGTRWKLANAHYYNGNLVGAAAALDQLADEAGLVGDLEVEALSIYYALLHSRYIPVALRDRLSDWLQTWREVAIK